MLTQIKVSLMYSNPYHVVFIPKRKHKQNNSRSRELLAISRLYKPIIERKLSMTEIEKAPKSLA